MEYSLVFTIYGLVFNIILLLTVIFKKLKKTPRTNAYITLIITSMFFAIAEIISILYFIATRDFNGYSIVWKIRNACIVFYVYVFIVYFTLLIKGEKYDSLFKIIFKTPLFLILFIFLLLLIILYIIFVPIADMSPDKLYYVRGIIAIVLVVLAIGTSIAASYVAFKVRKTNKNVSRSLVFTVLLFGILMPIQLWFNYISFVPFLTMFLMYVFYHNIENPDIELLEEVSSLKNTIDKSSNTKTDFLFNLSYDLINPMNTIVSLSQSLKSLSVDNKDEIYRDLKSIKYAGNTLLDSIDNILDMSETGNDLNINKEYSLYELLKRVETVAISRIGAKNIQFEMIIDDNISSKFVGDINKIQKILLNVVTNAVKYTEIGKIKLNVSFTSDKNAQVLHFKISDTGCGIKDEVKSFIFSDNQETSGVGLALTKKYVESMNGKITFDSVYTAGTTFYIDLPQIAVGSRLISEDKVATNDLSKMDYIDCSNYKVLIVDDDALDIKVTKRLIKNYKFQVFSVLSPLECVERIKKEEKFDLLLLDHKMSEMDGMQVMRILKQLEGYEIPKIVALTANASSGAREYYMNSGFDDYLSKPIDVLELDRIINKYFKK